VLLDRVDPEDDRAITDLVGDLTYAESEEAAAAVAG
jgi:hypothetical protein